MNKQQPDKVSCVVQDGSDWYTESLNVIVKHSSIDEYLTPILTT